MATYKRLDETGLSLVWAKIKAIIPTKTSDLTNDSGFITGYTETDPTVPSWAKASTKPTYTASEVGAQETLVSGTNIKTINGESILGSGDITVGGGGGGGGTLTDTYDSSTKTLTLGLSSGSLTDTYDSTTKTLTLSM